MRINRPLSESLDHRLGVRMPVLDHGFIRVVDYMGNDEAIVQAARVSYGEKKAKTLEENRALIRYLMRNRHTSPFEMCEIKLHVKLPIFVARQWIRHRTASVNEISGRYTVLDNEFYVPAIEDVAKQSKSNKQGRENSAMDSATANEILQILKADSLQSYSRYEYLIEDKELTRELARTRLTLNFYTQWYWKINLHNLLHFIGLRADSHAQKEIRDYADAICNIVKSWVPFTWEAFEDYRLKGAYFSAEEIRWIKESLSENRSLDTLKLSVSEKKEFLAKLGLST